MNELPPVSDELHHHMGSPHGRHLDPASSTSTIPAFSLIYNAIFATLALTGHISPLVAAVLMPLSGLTVVGHAVLSKSFSVPARHTRPASAVGEAAPAR